MRRAGRRNRRTESGNDRSLGPGQVFAKDQLRPEPGHDIGVDPSANTLPRPVSSALFRPDIFQVGVDRTGSHALSPSLMLGGGGGCRCCRVLPDSFKLKKRRAYSANKYLNLSAIDPAAAGTYNCVYCTQWFNRSC
jgi:hypothetical protein